MNRFLEKYNLKHIQNNDKGQITSDFSIYAAKVSTRLLLISIKKLNAWFKTYTHTSLSLHVFTNESFQSLKERVTQSLHKCFQK